jgi:hypothetical protein
MAPPPGNPATKNVSGELYDEIYNDRKQRLVKVVLEPGYAVVVEHKDIPKPKSWKRNKHTFFVYRRRFAGHASETIEVTTHPFLRASAYHAIYPLTHNPPPVRPPPMARVLHLEKSCGRGLAEVDR